MHNFSKEATSWLANQATLRILWSRMIYFLFQKTPSVVPVLSQISVPSCLIEAHIKRKGKFPSNFPNKSRTHFYFP
jgi:hypothetical protein